MSDRDKTDESALVLAIGLLLSLIAAFLILVVASCSSGDEGEKLANQTPALGEVTLDGLVISSATTA